MKMTDQLNDDLAPVVYVSTWRKTMHIDPYGSFDVEGSIADYVVRTQRAGATVRLIPRDIPERAAAALQGADGLVLIGGDDIDPSFYGQENQGSKPGSTEADAFDLALVREARRRRLPLFAICRGQQLVNVALGGTLHQDIAQDPIAHTPPPAKPGESPAAFHKVEIDPSSRVLANILDSPVKTNSIHHQSVDECAPELRVVARSADGIVEAVETDDTDWLLLSVQWHPEKMPEHQVMFDWFVKQIAELRNAQKPQSSRPSGRNDTDVMA